MLGMYNLLPLLKGWDYKVHQINRIVYRGADAIELAIGESGWLKALLLFTNDAVVETTLDFQGAELQTLSVHHSPEVAFQCGAFGQDPSGWVQRYSRPNPYSTAGAFVAIIFSGGYQGSAWPYVPTVKMSVLLPSTSTQAFASVLFSGVVIAITNPKAFIQSLRAVQAIKDLQIDRALLAVGPSELGVGYEK